MLTAHKKLQIMELDTSDKLRKILSRLPKMDHFQVLNVTPEATDLDIKAAFRKRSQRFHPDRFYSVDPETKELANAVYKQISTAYNAIKRPNLRMAYVDALQDNREENIKVNPGRGRLDPVKDLRKEKQTGPGARYYELALASYTAQDRRSALNNIRLAETMENDNPAFATLRAKIEQLS